MPNDERRVCRYETGFADTTTIRLPTGSRILSAQALGTRLFLFAEVDVATPTQYETHRVRAHKTGSAFKIPPNSQFLNSVFVPPDSAFHVFVDDETEQA
jgi:hypothetical protein